MGISAAVLALAGVLGAVSTDVAAGARLELMGGSAPVLPTEPPRAAFATELVPLAAIEFSDRRFRALIRYDPRLFLRQPNALGLDRPVYLHRAELEDRIIVSRTATFHASIRGSAGEVDYVGLAGVLPPTQLGQVSLPVIRLYDVEKTLGLDLRTDSRTILALSTFAGKGGPLDSGPSPLPTHTRAGAGPTVRHRLSRRDELLVPVLFEYHRVVTATAAEATAESAELDLMHRLSRRTTTTLGAGAMVAEYPGSSRSPAAIPAVTAAVTHAFISEPGRRLSGELGAGTRGVLNLLRVEYRPIASLRASLSLVVPPHWTATARANFSTAATSTPLPTGEPETYFSAETPVVYTIDENWAVEAGLRSLFRSPHLESGFRVEQTQFWVYAAVTALFGSAPDPRSTVR